MGVAVVLRRDSEILWGRRAFGPYRGAWCLPCGYVAWGEEVRQAAAREFKAETGVEVEVGEILAVHANFHDPARLTVGIWFAGKALAGALTPADDLAGAAFFPFELPPAPLAFPTDRLVWEELKAGKVLRIPDSPVP